MMRCFAWIILLLLMVPIVCLLPSLVAHPEGWLVWREADRIGDLIANSLWLALGSSLVAVPIGSILGVSLGRYAVPGRSLLMAFVLAALFIPLPVFAVAWQIVLGSWLPSLALDPGQVAWRPWRQGLLPAAFVHGVAAVPWVTLLTVGLLRRIDPGLEETARMDGGEAMVLRRVVWPRLRLAMIGSTVWVTVLAFTEISVTDAMMVRTFAEDVYTELVSNPAGVPKAIAASLPVWIVAAIIGCVIVSRVRDWPSSESTRATTRPTKTSVTVVAYLLVGLTAGLPLVALITKARSAGLIATLTTQLQNSGGVIVESLATSIVAGILTTGLAWFACCQLGRRSVIGLSLVAVILWLLPGPLLGFGMKELIRLLCDLEEKFIGRDALEFPPIRSLLYDQPSPVPAILTAIVRFFPLAIAAILPAVRAIPVELIDLARLEGLTPWQRFGRIIRPLTGQAVLRAMLAVSLLALGEVSASKLVNPPGRQAFILDLFNQMHYGAEATVAGLCLVQVALTAGLVSVGWIVFRDTKAS